MGIKLKGKRVMAGSSPQGEKINCAFIHLITYNFFLHSTAEFSAGGLVLFSMQREISQLYTEIALSANFFVFACNDQKKLKLKPQNSGPCPHILPPTQPVWFSLRIANLLQDKYMTCLSMA